MTTRSPGSLTPGLPASVTNDFLATPQPLEDFLATLGFVELEVAEERFGNSEMLQQQPGAPRVLGGDDIALL